MPLILLLILAVLAFLVWRVLARRQERARLLGTPLTGRERRIVDAAVPLLQKLPAPLHRKLEGKINLFRDQVEFIGCDGLDVTDEMELSIAAQACLMVVNTDTWYKHLRTILIYPGAFKSHQQSHDGYVVTEEEQVRLGESWAYGPVVLSWPHSEQGAVNEVDGHNVVFHEFAHQIDQLSGTADGAPLLSKGQSFETYERVILDAFEAHVRNVEAGRKTVLDEYGATAHEEFFAVAVEVFFEKPVQLRREEPGVYEQLALIFNLDPAEWV